MGHMASSHCASDWRESRPPRMYLPMSKLNGRHLVVEYFNPWGCRERGNPPKNNKTCKREHHEIDLFWVPSFWTEETNLKTLRYNHISRIFGG